MNVEIKNTNELQPTNDAQTEFTLYRKRKKKNKTKQNKKLLISLGLYVG